MNYEATIEFLFEQLPMYQRSGKAAYKANLDNTHALDSFLGHPHRNFRSVHVAGTNGKGSVSHMLASVLTAAGFKTGLYTSPHLLDFRERIMIDGEMIGKEEVVDFTERICETLETIQPSFFEMTVAMAFDHFARSKVDIAVIETGMGGRLDSTNIIAPILSIITNISLDHTEFLGGTIELIAAEKGGIIKEEVPLVVGENTASVIRVLSDMAAKKKAPFTEASTLRSFSFQTQTPDQEHTIFHYKNLQTDRSEDVKTDLGGHYQKENINTVLAAIDNLRASDLDIPPKAIERGLSAVKTNTSLRGRWEILGANPRIICDTAHNTAGVSAVSEHLRNIQHRHLHIVWGMVGDKPAGELLGLMPAEATWYFTQPSIPRAMNVEDLRNRAEAAGLHGKAFPTVLQAFEAAKREAGMEDTVFIGGSTFVVADLLASLEI